MDQLCTVVLSFFSALFREQIQQSFLSFFLISRLAGIVGFQTRNGICLNR